MCPHAFKHLSHFAPLFLCVPQNGIPNCPRKAQRLMLSRSAPGSEDPPALSLCAPGASRTQNEL